MNTNRRSFLKCLPVAAGCLLLAACGGGSGATPAGSAASPAGSGAAGKPAGSGAQASGAQTNWDALIAAAKKEGTLTLAVAPGGGSSARDVIPPAFKQDFGIDVEVLVGPSSQLVTRLKLEQSSGQSTVDVTIGGADTMYSSFYGDKLIEPMKPLLINPEAINPSSWFVGHPWFMDPEQQSILRIASGLSSFNVVNSTMVKPSELGSWDDWLKPQYKGKISSFDPTINGAGGQHAAYIEYRKGPDFIKQLYAGQQVTFTQDMRQFADWVGQGKYPIGLGMSIVNIESLKKDGFPVEILPSYPETPGYITGGSGLMAVLKNPPHPNAAQLFVNWMAMDRGQSVYDKAVQLISPRTTVKSDWAPDYAVPKPGVDYTDTYSWDYTNTTYPQAFKAVRQALGAPNN
jgi:ABC-type Fe3+ transport system substrate-binding protein